MEHVPHVVSAENELDPFQMSLLSSSLCTYFLCRQLQEAFPGKVISSKPPSLPLPPSLSQLEQETGDIATERVSKGAAKYNTYDTRTPSILKLAGQPRYPLPLKCLSLFFFSMIKMFPITHMPIFKFTFHWLGVQHGKIQ